MEKRIFLSPPHMCGLEEELVKKVFQSNWVAPAGPDIEMFEEQICSYTGVNYTVALASGTAAIHLSLIINDVSEGDEVLCSSFTFAGTVFPAVYQKAIPVFIDCEKKSWNIDPELFELAVKDRIKKGKKPKAAIIVHLYGQSADMESIKKICTKYDIVLIEDAAESFGSYFGDKHTGSIGKMGIFSFNGNKIITTSGGGALVSDDKELIDKARYLSTQARSPVPYYHHIDTGYNYRLSNVCAAIGRGQLSVIDQRVKRRREIYQQYKNALQEIEEIELMPNDIYGQSNCWISCIIINSSVITPEKLRVALENENIESRPLWKPMHMQPVFQNCPYYGNGASDILFDKGLCLPSGSSMTDDDINRVVAVIKNSFRNRI